MAPVFLTTPDDRGAPEQQALRWKQTSRQFQAIEARHVTSKAIQSHLVMPQTTALLRLRALTDRGLIDAIRPATSRRQSYRLSQPKEN